MSSGKSTRFFYLFIIALVLSGIFLFLYQLGVLKNELFASTKPLFTPDEFCELLKLDADDRAELLLTKGLREFDDNTSSIDYHSENEEVVIYFFKPKPGEYPLFTISIKYEYKDIYLGIMTEVKKKYTIHSTEKVEENNVYDYKLSENCYLFDYGFERKSTIYFIGISEKLQ